MNPNIANGGLVLKANGKLLLSDIHNFNGTLVQDIGSGETTVLESINWFMNFDGITLYYSDQKNGNTLWSHDLSRRNAELLLDEPVYSLVHSGEWLYYVNENDRKLYRCLTNGRSEKRLDDEQVLCFFVQGDNIFYATQQGIRTCSLDGRGKESIIDAVAIRMVMIGEQIAFVDKGNQYALTVLDLRTGRSSIFDDLLPVSLTTDGRYLYSSNRKNNRTIYRIDVEQGTSIRICGESADYLHIIDDQLYFYSKHDWFRMSLLGGQAMKVTTLSRG